MISGTSKILSKFGPVDLLTITRMARTIQEKLWNHPGNILLFRIWGSENVFSSFQILRYGRIICFKDDSIFFLYLLKYVGDSWEVSGSRFWQNFHSSRNHLKSIAIWPGTLISHFGIIKTQKNWNIAKTEKNKKNA